LYKSNSFWSNLPPLSLLLSSNSTHACFSGENVRVVWGKTMKKEGKEGGKYEKKGGKF
jgi:hypothetical protein